MNMFQQDVTSAGSGSATFMLFTGNYVNGDHDTPALEEVAVRNYRPVPQGHYRLKLTGLAEPKDVDIPEQFRREGGPTTRKETRLVLEIAEGRGKGHQILINYVTMSLYDNANLFRIYKATVCGGDKSKAPARRDAGDMIGMEFQAMIMESDRRDDQTGRPLYNKIAWDTVSAVAPPAVADDDPWADEEEIA